MGQTKKGTLLQGSLDLLVLQSLKGGAMHGYAITRHIKEKSQDYLQVEEGSLYPALHRMELRGWIVSFWGTSESNRRAKFYELSSDGRKQLKQETDAWKHMSQAIDRVLGFQS
jgi:PadR family transcriptional regulator, regulatory protein PadR